ncbi:Uu.00g054200.m01.CDS01 [Anthostomella pinea]|uniref:Uu.00g054200.m01.CDS01 n=1 Tax=Anthostomella pinea TaxID=933095 RepID=A0AAI8VXH2_9PEZI|nr:Uu.00g054200.m01.CDS01 [Anthostomella pinea]
MVFLRTLPSHARQPRVYFVGRRQDEGRRIETEIKALNPDGQYEYLPCDVSLLNNVDELCRLIRRKESSINLLFVSSGTLIRGKEEGLHYPMAVTYYSRMRCVVNLLPLLKQATSLRRVVTVFAGTMEGAIFPDGFQARGLSIRSMRGHCVSMITLALESIAKQAPEVSFVHDYPGFVKTGLSRELKGPIPAIASVFFAPVMALLNIPIEEVGERQVFFATSARFPPGSGEMGTDGVALDAGVCTATSTEGKIGGGVYSICYKAEGLPWGAQEILAGLRKDGTTDKVWEHTKDEFIRITGALSV